MDPSHVNIQIIDEYHSCEQTSHGRQYLSTHITLPIRDKDNSFSRSYPTPSNTQATAQTVLLDVDDPSSCRTTTIDEEDWEHVYQGGIEATRLSVYPHQYPQLAFEITPTDLHCTARDTAARDTAAAAAAHFRTRKRCSGTPKDHTTQKIDTP